MWQARLSEVCLNISSPFKLLLFHSVDRASGESRKSPSSSLSAFAYFLLDLPSQPFHSLLRFFLSVCFSLSSHSASSLKSEILFHLFLLLIPFLKHDRMPAIWTGTEGKKFWVMPNLPSKYLFLIQRVILTSDPEPFEDVFIFFFFLLSSRHRVWVTLEEVVLILLTVHEGCNKP